MPYVLFVVAAVIVLFGAAKLRRAGLDETLWTGLLAWAALLGVGVSVWVLSLLHHR